MSQNATIAIAFTAAAAASGGPLAEVFDEMGLVMALLGALGGSLRFAAVRRMTRKRSLGAELGEMVSSITIGGGLAFGLGGLPVELALSMANLDIAPDDPGTKFLAAVAFLIGLAQERFLTYTGFYKQPEPMRPDDD